jgi:hypothetical protein
MKFETKVKLHGFWAIWCMVVMLCSTFLLFLCGFTFIGFIFLGFSAGLYPYIDRDFNNLRKEAME